MKVLAAFFVLLGYDDRQFLESRKTNGEPYMLDNLKESFKGVISVLHFIIVVGVIL